jgi:lipid-A-disaccharide synthase
MANSDQAETKSQTIALVAGEASGDNLGAPLIRELKQKYPNARFVGVGGPAMIAEGMDSWFDMERLSVNGFVDPIKRLPELLNILWTIRSRLLRSPPICFVGVDFNFFNLLLEGMLRKRGIKTVHYVSPTVWAWRPGRIKSIARNVDLMLTLYPFETDIYLKNGVDVAFVGHPKAYEIELDEGTDKKAAARQMLDYREDDPIVAILPGSRRSEVTYSGPDFFAAAGLIKKAAPGCRFLVAAANDRLASNINSLLLESGQNLDIKVVVGRSREVLTAADVVLVNSGTATLEAMLLKKPMVMSYRLGSATYALVSRLVKTKYFALPNILAGHELVPELIQKDATPEALSKAVLALFNPETRDSLITKFDTIHRQLRVEKYEAAQAILTLCGEKPGHGEADVSP